MRVQRRPNANASRSSCVLLGRGRQTWRNACNKWPRSCMPGEVVHWI